MIKNVAKLRRRILVAGSSGFVGGAIVREAIAANHFVAGISRSGTGPAACLTCSFEVDALAQAIADFKPDMVVHAAGLASVHATEADPNAGISASVEPFRNVVEAIERAGIDCALVLISSAAVYGNPLQLPVAEQAPLAPISAYGRQRVQCEELAAGLARRRNVPVFSVRGFSLFGVRQRRLLVWELFNRIRNDDRVVIAGTGDEVRDFLGVGTFAHCVLRLADVRTPGFQPINIASGSGTRVRGLAELMLSVMGVDKTIVCEGRTFANDPLRWQADVTRYRDLTGVPIEHDLRRSLAAVVEAWR